MVNVEQNNLFCNLVKKKYGVFEFDVFDLRGQIKVTIVNISWWISKIVMSERVNSQMK